MNRMLSAPGTEFGKFNFPLHHFLVLMSVVIAPFTNGTAQSYEIVRVFDLRHVGLILAHPCMDFNPLLRERLDPARIH
jgi:hypothetical protein